MKHTSVLALIAASTMPFGLHAAPVSYQHTNEIVSHNIVAIQHSAMLNTFGKFNAPHKKSPAEFKDQENEVQDQSQYYGKMALYGIDEDEEIVLSFAYHGADDDVTLPKMTWVDWQHSNDDAKFDHFSKIDSRYDIISLGFSDNPEKFDGGISGFAGFGGVIIANQNSGDVKLDETGEYLGLYRGYHINGFTINMAANIGTMFSDAKSAYGKYDLTNLWAGAAFDASYDILIGHSFVLRPGIYSGYTWIYSDGHDSESGHDLSFDNFNAFELSPEMSIITHISNGWFSTMSARYVFNFTDGGTAHIAGTHISELDPMNYGEYGLSIGKGVEHFNVSASLNYRDGDRSGWSGGIQLRCLF